MLWRMPAQQSLRPDNLPGRSVDLRLIVLLANIGNPAYHKNGTVLFIGLHLAPAGHPYDLACLSVDSVFHIMIILDAILE